MVFPVILEFQLKKTLVLANTFTQVIYEVPFLHFASSIIWMKVRFSRRKGDLLPLGWKVALRWDLRIYYCNFGVNITCCCFFRLECIWRARHIWKASDMTATHRNFILIMIIYKRWAWRGENPTFWGAKISKRMLTLKCFNLLKCWFMNGNTCPNFKCVCIVD